MDRQLHRIPCRLRYEQLQRSTLHGYETDIAKRQRKHPIFLVAFLWSEMHVLIRFNVLHMVSSPRQASAAPEVRRDNAAGIVRGPRPARLSLQ
jgi:hypothetical protein